ncbi:hypothetical protein [Methylocystis sp.]|uniref:hypothetical protein n=1 Tax=Methylocystis sp. TaxID=1911079 RepID=UPI003D0A9888
MRHNTGLSSISTAYKDRQLEQYKSESRERVSNAEAAAKKAQESAALADERSKVLALEADKARLETERIKAQLAWRSLPPDIGKQLKTALSQHAGKANIQHVANDPEALYLAIQIANIFGEAKWEIQMLAVTMSGSLPFGIFIPESQSPDLPIIRASFTSAHIPFSQNQLPASGMGFGGSIPDAPIVFVGSKPPVR